VGQILYITLIPSKKNGVNTISGYGIYSGFGVDDASELDRLVLAFMAPIGAKIGSES